MTPRDLTDICRSLGLSRSALAEQLGVSRQTIQEWHNGKRPIPDARAVQIRRLASSIPTGAAIEIIPPGARSIREKRRGHPAERVPIRDPGAMPARPLPVYREPPPRPPARSSDSGWMADRAVVLLAYAAGQVTADEMAVLSGIPRQPGGIRRAAIEAGARLNGRQNTQPMLPYYGASLMLPYDDPAPAFTVLPSPGWFTAPEPEPPRQPGLLRRLFGRSR